MKITKVTYQNAYVTGPYLQHKPGFEAEIDGTIEDPIEALLKLKAIADEFDKRVNNFDERLVPVVQAERFDNTGIIDEELETAKAKLVEFEYREDAEEYLIASGFRFNIELKNIANSKSSKNV